MSLFKSNETLAKELVKLTGCDYYHALDNLNGGASFCELYDFYYYDYLPKGTNDYES